MTTPVQRTLKLIREQGATPWIVERFIHQRNLKIDFLHIIDLISLSPDSVSGWQVCGNDFKAHLDKIMIQHMDNTKIWLAAPGTRMFLIGWRKLKVKRGGKAMKWVPKIAVISLLDNIIVADVTTWEALVSPDACKW